METQSANQWKKESGFVWAVLGSVIGFANVLSFSAQCYRNGGGAFLIPYFLAYVVLGMPMLFMEGLIGQRMRSPLVTAYGKSAGRIGKYFGWIAILSCLTIGAFYIVLTSYSLIYTYFGISGSIPADTATFFKDAFLHSTNSIGDFGAFAWNIFLVVLLIGAFVWWTLIKNISSGIEKICSFIMPLLTILIVGFAIVASFLPGAMSGVAEYVRPDFSRLNDIKLWRDVFGQLFFSLSLGLGIITGYSQYNGKNVNLKEAMTIVAIGDFVISFIAGWIVFACIGYMSHHSLVPFHSLVQSSSSFEIGFIIFPKIIQTFSPIFQPLLGGIFFFCIFIAGITGVFSIVESVVGNMEREFKQSRKKAVTIGIGLITAIGVFFCMGNGQLLVGAFEPLVFGLNMILSASTEIIVFLFMTKMIRDDVIWSTKRGKKQLYFYALKYIVPVILIAIFIGAAVSEFSVIDMSFYLRASWFIIASAATILMIRRAEKSPEALTLEASRS